jgi:hypothetical protein
MSDKVVFHNFLSGETLVHRDRADGKRDLKFGETGTNLEGHAVLDQSGMPSFIRDTDGRIIANDRLP